MHRRLLTLLASAALVGTLFVAAPQHAAARTFAIAMTAAVTCMAVGTVLLLVDPPWTTAAGWPGTVGGWLVAVAVMMRPGMTSSVKSRVKDTTPLVSVVARMNPR